MPTESGKASITPTLGGVGNPPPPAVSSSAPPPTTTMSTLPSSSHEDVETLQPSLRSIPSSTFPSDPSSATSPSLGGSGGGTTHSHTSPPVGHAGSSSTTVGAHQPPVLPRHLKRKLAGIIEACRKCRQFHLFLEPVDVVAMECPTYYDLIQHPMDLATMEEKLHTNQYAVEDDFLKDMMLIFSNCRLFNRPGNPSGDFVLSLCWKSEEKFIEEWRRHLRDSNKSSKVIKAFVDMFNSGTGRLADGGGASGHSSSAKSSSSKDRKARKASSSSSSSSSLHLTDTASLPSSSSSAHSHASAVNKGESLSLSSSDSLSSSSSSSSRGSVGRRASSSSSSSIPPSQTLSCTSNTTSASITNKAVGGGGDQPSSSSSPAVVVDHPERSSFSLSSSSPFSVAEHLHPGGSASTVISIPSSGPSDSPPATTSSGSSVIMTDTKPAVKGSSSFSSLQDSSSSSTSSVSPAVSVSLPESVSGVETPGKDHLGSPTTTTTPSGISLRSSLPVSTTATTATTTSPSSSSFLPSLPLKKENESYQPPSLPSISSSASSSETLPVEGEGEKTKPPSLPPLGREGQSREEAKDQQHQSLSPSLQQTSVNHEAGRSKVEDPLIHGSKGGEMIGNPSQPHPQADSADLSCAFPSGETDVSRAGGGTGVVGGGSAISTPVGPNKTWQIYCKDYMLRPLKCDRYGYLFSTPVLASAELPQAVKENYMKIISRPMDYGTIWTKLSSRAYSHPNEFRDDMLLVSFAFSSSLPPFIFVESSLSS
ncbi:bromodomain-containing protein [Cystoisospora suis]|uniref:Bromodomain-containing protein n=1 Tax=Cystoisospora suis TaxID=483139 RepID=A0A2C6LC97_9APIC|nr:bromodomain-containing protein [Cystoisospora suis]